MNKEQILKEITDACVVAYERAKKGGYKGRLYAPKLGAELLDPLFWQALGKAEGWITQEDWFHYGQDENESIIGGVYWYYWQYQMHEFVEHIIEGNSTDEFFDNILKSND